MEFFLSTFSFYLTINLAFSAPLEGRDDPPNPDDDGADDLTANLPSATRAPTDCGTFKFKCNKSAGACNNACYFINCVNKGNNKFTFGPNSVDNRVHSGCTTSRSSTLCKLLPISQRMWDRQPDDLAPKPLQCDEFPMNAFKQDAFKQGDTPRNSLRCINGSQNGSKYGSFKRGGGQFKNFQRGFGDWAPGGSLAGDKKCSGAMIDGDTFSVSWIIDGDDGVADQDKFVPYCKPNPVCTNDGYQFHMTKPQLSIKDGKPGKTGSMIKIFHEGADQFTIEVFVVNGPNEVSKGQKTDVMKSGGQIEVTGLPKSLFVFSRGDPGTKVDFNYAKPGTTFLTEDFAGGDFVWDTDDTGIAGAYCQVGGVYMIGDRTQNIVCDFPGLEDA
ncbi:hypothetical protein HYALB_00011523 [Hymenoscyphus albidus]|uniref:Uncharacterized protein n=1 Tax=Hymenoscyphus albidus TaxID=595503 RepID=A0A9N9LQV2_9HELO|nr:hypothetical protein HYALB_00011523 [Hymenoscyphus albidus]